MLWEKSRYEEICDLLRPFLQQSGFQPSKTKFVPVGAMAGVNLVKREGSDAAALNKWYKGPTLVDLLGQFSPLLASYATKLMSWVDKLEPPNRDILAPLRFPISNVYKGQSSGTAVAGRVCSGLLQIGERLRVLPGDETAIVKGLSDQRPVELLLTPPIQRYSLKTLTYNGLPLVPTSRCS